MAASYADIRFIRNNADLSCAASVGRHHASFIKARRIQIRGNMMAISYFADKYGRKWAPYAPKYKYHKSAVRASSNIQFRNELVGMRPSLEAPCHHLNHFGAKYQ